MVDKNLDIILSIKKEDRKVCIIIELNYTFVNTYLVLSSVKLYKSVTGYFIFITYEVIS